jgi:PAS domain S-box-containing protein
MTTYALLPGFWNRIKVDGANLPSHGFATYRLTVLLDKPAESLKLHHGCVYYAFRLYVNERLIASEGKIADNAKDEIPENRPMTVDIPNGDKRLDIVLQVSNYHHINGGPGEVFTFGTGEAITNYFETRIFFEFFLFGCFALMGLYHLILFLHRHSDRANLFFALFCFSSTVLLLGSFSQVYFFKLFFPELSRNARYIMVFLAVSIMPATIYSFFRSIFKEETSLIIALLFWVLSLASAATVLFMPIEQIPYIEKASEALIILSLLISLASTFLAALHKRKGSIVIFMGFTILTASAVIDVLAVNGIIFRYDTVISPFGLLAMTVFMAYVVASRMSRTFLEAERLNIELNRDIERRKQLECKLDETSTYFSNVFNSISAVIVTVDENATITGWNARAEKYTHIASEGAIGKPVWDLLPIANKHRKSILNIINKTAPRAIARLSFRLDIERFFDVVVTPFETLEGKGAVILADEVTEIEKKDQQLRLIEKMDMIGTLAGGLAHDFNNIIAGIIGPVSIIQNRQKSQGAYDLELIEKYVPVISESAHKASAMIQRLLSLSRSHEGECSPVDLNEIVREIIETCESSFDKNIEIEASYNQSPAVVNAEASQLKHSIMNLCLNASHAMTIMKPVNEPFGGKLTVSIGMIHADALFCESHPGASLGNYWTVTIRDTGVGMSEDMIQRIYDPFFTTKPVEHGIGLGLSMVYSIIKQHGGFMTVYSEPLRGSQFMIFLPVYQESSSFFSEFDYKMKKFSNEIVLIIDHDPNSRTSLELLLNELGVSCLSASSSEEGIGIFRDKSQQIKAIILDMMMPVKPGRETFLDIKSINPDIPVVISSGLGRDDRIETMFLMGIKGFIQKPYTLHTLVQVLNTILR